MLKSKSEQLIFLCGGLMQVIRSHKQQNFTSKTHFLSLKQFLQLNISFLCIFLYSSIAFTHVFEPFRKMRKKSSRLTYLPFFAQTKEFQTFFFISDQYQTQNPDLKPFCLILLLLLYNPLYILSYYYIAYRRKLTHSVVL